MMSILRGLFKFPSASINIGCEICDNLKYPPEKYRLVNENLETYTQKDFPKKHFLICTSCLTIMMAKIQDLNKMSPKELPLLIADPNPFIRSHAIKLLEACNV